MSKVENGSLSSRIQVRGADYPHDMERIVAIANTASSAPATVERVLASMATRAADACTSSWWRSTPMGW